ncbi:hypothetical protein [Thauera humireducens]
MMSDIGRVTEAEVPDWPAGIVAQPPATTTATSKAASANLRFMNDPP